MMVAITVGVPVFKGQEFIAETMNSILEQTAGDFKVLLSVDGGDDVSAAVCEPFLHDARVGLVQQSKQLGWALHLNWLMARCETEFFCYWQQDDLAEANYLESLLATMQRHSTAACAYCDVEWFGTRKALDTLPSVVGAPVERMLTLMRSPASWVPFRGVMRRTAVELAGPIRTNHRMSSLEDMVWMVQLGRAGELLRVEDTLYFKRSHDSQLHLKWSRWSAEEKRDAWIHHGLGLLETILPAGRPEDRLALVDAVIERLTSRDRWRLYDATDADFRIDFIAAAQNNGVAHLLPARVLMGRKIQDWLLSRPRPGP